MKLKLTIGHPSSLAIRWRALLTGASTPTEEDQLSVEPSLLLRPSWPWKAQSSLNSWNCLCSIGRACVWAEKTIRLKHMDQAFQIFLKKWWCSIKLLKRIKTQFRVTEGNNVTSTLNHYPSWLLSSCHSPSAHSAIYLLVTYSLICSVPPLPQTHTLCQALCPGLGTGGWVWKGSAIWSSPSQEELAIELYSYVAYMTLCVWLQNL